MRATEFPFHYERTAVLNAPIDAAFAHLDDFHKLSAHMEQSSGTPPTRKAWRTLDTDLLVIGAYSVGFELHEHGQETSRRVFIDYDLPKTGVGRWLARLFGGAMRNGVPRRWRRTLFATSPPPRPLQFEGRKAHIWRAYTQHPRRVRNAESSDDIRS